VAVKNVQEWLKREETNEEKESENVELKGEKVSWTTIACCFFCNTKTLKSPTI